MLLIADSGSTKTDWVLIDTNKDAYKYHTAGLNPNFIDGKGIHKEILKSLPLTIFAKSIENIYFFGAGCFAKDRKEIVKSSLKSIFFNANIEVDTDMVGAAKALFNNESGIAAILGTGSNTCLWDGVNCMKNIRTHGFILGDEGSGAYFGLILIKAYLNGSLPNDLKEKFEDKYKLSVDQIINNVYSQPFPNRFLASFMPFYSENTESPFILDQLEKGFNDFIRKYLLKYEDCKNNKVRFVGSVAFHFKELLIAIGQKNNLIIDEVINHPMDKLVEIYNK